MLWVHKRMPFMWKNQSCPCWLCWQCAARSPHTFFHVGSLFYVSNLLFIIIDWKVNDGFSHCGIKQDAFPLVVICLFLFLPSGHYDWLAMIGLECFPVYSITIVIPVIGLEAVTTTWKHQTERLFCSLAPLFVLKPIDFLLYCRKPYVIQDIEKIEEKLSIACFLHV